MPARRYRQKISFLDGTQEDDDKVNGDTAIDWFKAARGPDDTMGGSVNEKVWSDNDGHIYFHADVSKDSVYRLNKLLLDIQQDFDDLKRANPGIQMTPSPIYLHLNTYGGSVFAAFHAIDIIQQSPIPIYTIVEGATASAGTLMSVVGKRRFIRPHASMLIHELSSWFGGKMTNIEDEYKNLRQMMDDIKTIYLQNTGLGKEEMEDLLKHDLWLKADKCIEKGLADAVWTGTDLGLNSNL